MGKAPGPLNKLGPFADVTSNFKTATHTSHTSRFHMRHKYECYGVCVCVTDRRLREVMRLVLK